MWCHASGMPVCDVMVAVKAKVAWRGGGSVHTQFQVPHGTLPARCSRPPISTSTTRYCCRCGTAVTDEQSHAVLPTISPGATFVITLAAMLVRSCLHTPWARQTRTPIDVPSLTRTLIQTHTHAQTHTASAILSPAPPAGNEWHRVVACIGATALADRAHTSPFATRANHIRRHRPQRLRACCTRA